MNTLKHIFRNTILAIMSIAALVAFCACASSGNRSLKRETERTVNAKIIIGHTTKAQIKTMFGSPGSASFTDNGLEIWHYDLTKMHASGVNFIPIVNFFGSRYNGTMKSLVILFDDNDVVKKFTMSESPVSTGTGVFR